MTIPEAIVLSRLSFNHVGQNEERDISRILEAMRLTVDAYNHPYPLQTPEDAWEAAAEQLLGDEYCVLVFRPAAVASAEAARIN